jgi:hypothetical protein
MLLTFLGALSVAVLAACVAFVIRRFWGVQARWLIPVSAGAAMLGFTIWNDYSWFGRQVDGLPEGVVVIESYTWSAAIQPWTLLAPAVNRYSALDRRALDRHPERPEIVRAPVFFAQRYQPTAVSAQIVDCQAGRRADAADAGPDGLPPEGAWIALPRDHPLLAAACGEEAG